MRMPSFKSDKGAYGSPEEAVRAAALIGAAARQVAPVEALPMKFDWPGEFLTGVLCRADSGIVNSFPLSVGSSGILLDGKSGKVETFSLDPAEAFPDDQDKTKLAEYRSADIHRAYISKVGDRYVVNVPKTENPAEVPMVEAPRVTTEPEIDEFGRKKLSASDFANPIGGNQNPQPQVRNPSGFLILLQGVVRVNRSLDTSGSPEVHILESSKHAEAGKYTFLIAAREGAKLSIEMELGNHVIYEVKSGALRIYTPPKEEPAKQPKGKSSEAPQPRPQQAAYETDRPQVISFQGLGTYVNFCTVMADGRIIDGVTSADGGLVSGYITAHDYPEGTTPSRNTLLANETMYRGFIAEVSAGQGKVPVLNRGRQVEAQSSPQFTLYVFRGYHEVDVSGVGQVISKFPTPGKEKRFDTVIVGNGNSKLNVTAPEGTLMLKFGNGRIEPDDSAPQRPTSGAAPSNATTDSAPKKKWFGKR